MNISIAIVTVINCYYICIFVCRVLKKCGKKMPRYCDVNNDKKITISEWLNCLQVNGDAQKPKTSETSKSYKLRFLKFFFYL